MAGHPMDCFLISNGPNAKFEIRVSCRPVLFLASSLQTEDQRQAPGPGIGREILGRVFLECILGWHSGSYPVGGILCVGSYPILWGISYVWGRSWGISLRSHKDAPRVSYGYPNRPPFALGRILIDFDVILRRLCSSLTCSGVAGNLPQQSLKNDW